ncbi:MAG: hypothetical protein JWP01_513 [Myxococcales bacterium]|nr:hypothetical protein [Myxococcales bacterium]
MCLVAPSLACGGRETELSRAPIQGESSAKGQHSAEELALAGEPAEAVVQAFQDEQKRAATAAEKKWNDAQLARLHEVYGAKPAQMGFLVDDIQLGAKGDWSRERGSVYQQIAPRLGDGLLDVSFDDREGTLTEVTIVLPGEFNEEVLEKLEQDLTSAWGRSPTKIWYDPTTRQRANLASKLNTLTFTHYRDPIDWVNELPLAMIGTPVEKVIATKGAHRSEDGLVWNGLGLPTGTGDTEFVAYTGAKKVIAISVHVRGDSETVRDALTARLRAKPTMKSDGGQTEWVWLDRVPVALTQHGSDEFSMLIGSAWRSAP